MTKLLALYHKHRDVLPYLFWGVAATVFNIVVFFHSYDNLPRLIMLLTIRSIGS